MNVVAIFRSNLVFRDYRGETREAMREAVEQGPKRGVLSSAAAREETKF